MTAVDDADAVEPLAPSKRGFYGDTRLIFVFAVQVKNGLRAVSAGRLLIRHVRLRVGFRVGEVLPLAAAETVQFLGGKQPLGNALGFGEELKKLALKERIEP
ncbi:hypothetical protein SDC9_55947 [bioreactor metagenome]|uniref:Uncharacterized protein n=1 Tax=bioreactor metagenome TaxID=1076179 RepID=A0A644X0E8_9ZZZZ